jgi:leader peptidase (prepilin peptidase)/N-methyltransferase
MLSARLPYTNPDRQSQIETGKRRSIAEMPASFEGLIVLLTDTCLVLFVFVIGANIGSFLNVVVHRLPRGESVVLGGSHCPACGAAIRWRDNVPVLGWLLLRGRCRDCGATISSRYPLVEAVTAMMVGLVASVELLSGGMNLPGARFAGRQWGGDALLLNPDWLLVAACVLHCVVLVTLLAWALLDEAGQQVPWPWAAVALSLTGAAVLALPELMPVGVGIGPQQGPVRGLIASAAGLAVGWLAGRGLGDRTAAAGLMLLGTALGWQAAVSVAALTLAVGGMRRMLAAAPGGKAPGKGVSTDLVVAAVTHQLAWRGIDRLWRLAAWCIFSESVGQP